MKCGIFISAAICSLFGLIGCGGGGSDNSSSNKTSLNGVAAVGAPLANAVITIKDANGKTLSTTSDSTGFYSFSDFSGFVGPLLIQATGTAGGFEYVLHSVLNNAPVEGLTGTLNTNPATDAITTQAFGESPSIVMADTDKIKALNSAQLNQSKAAVTASLAETLKVLGLDASKIDLMTTSFTANSTGVDKMLDLVEFSTQSQDIKISLKSTGQTVTVAPTSTASSVAKSAAPTSADISLDLSGINTLVNSASALLKTQAGITSSQMLTLFSSSYLDQGQTREEQITQLQKLAGASLGNYVVKRCDGASKICYGTVSLIKPDGTTNSGKVMPVILGNDGQWRFYGDQAKFAFEISPAYQEHYSVNGGQAQRDIQQTGLNIYIPGSRIYGGTREYVAGRIYLSFDGGQSYETLNEGLQFKVKSGCDQGLISARNIINNECNNFVDFSDQDSVVNNFNAASESGRLKMKLALYKSSNMSDQPIETPLVFPTMFTLNTGAAAMIESGLSVTDADLGTNRIRFSGANFDFLNANVGLCTATSASNSCHSFTFDNNLSVKALRNDLTLEKFKNNCGDSCANLPADSVFTHIDLQIRDRQGRQFSIHKQFIPPSSSP